MPGKWNCDPYVTQANRYPVLASERRYYSAICQIGNNEEWKTLVLYIFSVFYLSFLVFLFSQEIPSLLIMNS